MVIDSAELAGLEVLTLVHENTAAALMYAIDTKNLPSQVPKTMLIINQGHNNFETSIVRFNKTKDPKKDKEILTVEILEDDGIEFTGGLDMNTQIVRILGEKFDNQEERKGKPSLFSNMKSIRRLFKEADNQKEILSANKEMNIKIPEILDQVDLITKLTRDEFDAKIQPIIQNIDTVLDRVLKSDYIKEVTDIELLGGGLWVPLVKRHLETWLKEIGKDLPLGSHLNSDEAMAFGAGYMGANYSSTYKVPKVYMYQHVPETIYLNVSETGCKGEDCFSKSMTLF